MKTSIKRKITITLCAILFAWLAYIWQGTLEGAVCGFAALGLFLEFMFESL